MRTQRTRADRRKAALEQTRQYTYENSKASRNGVEESVWEKDRQAFIKHLESIRV